MAYVSGIDSGIIVKTTSEYPKNIKSFTNKDPSYNYLGTSRRPRPLKHYRKGYPSTFESDKQTISGNGMPRLLTNMQEMPGTSVSGLGTCKEGVACSTELLNGSAPCCPGGVVYRPNDNRYNPRYKNSTLQYLQGRCITYQQNVYDFVGPKSIPENTYIVKCDQPVLSNICSKTAVYKPSNPQFAIQGAVQSSTRTFRLASQTVDRSIPYTNTYPKYFVTPPKTTSCI